MQLGANVLFIHDSSLPSVYTDGVVTGREMRLIQDIPFVDKIYAIGRNGNDLVQSPGTRIEPKITVIRIPHTETKNFSYLYRAFESAERLMASHRIDILHAESPLFSGPVAFILSRLHRIPLIVEVRSDYFGIVRDRTVDYYSHYVRGFIKRIAVSCLMRLSLRGATAVIANSDYHLQEAIRLGAVKQVYEVNPGVWFDPDMIEECKKTKSAVLTIGFIGRLSSLKGVEYLIHSVHRLASSGRLENFRVLIVGDGPNRSALEALVKNLQMSEVVHFLGILPSVRAICQFDMLVNPSITPSALDMVNVESYACGIPVVAFGKNGKPETVKDGITGIIVEPKDIEGLSRAIEKLANDPELRYRYGSGGKQLLEEKYTYSQQRDSMQDLYTSALSKRRLFQQNTQISTLNSNRK